MLSDDERAMLTRWTRRQKSSQALAMRATIMLAAALCSRERSVKIRQSILSR
jgi:hypothetical protein